MRVSMLYAYLPLLPFSICPSQDTTRVCACTFCSALTWCIYTSCVYDVSERMLSWATIHEPEAQLLNIWFSPILWRQQFLLMCGGLGRDAQQPLGLLGWDDIASSRHMKCVKWSLHGTICQPLWCCGTPLLGVWIFKGHLAGWQVTGGWCEKSIPGCEGNVFGVAVEKACKRQHPVGCVMMCNSSQLCFQFLLLRFETAFYQRLTNVRPADASTTCASTNGVLDPWPVLCWPSWGKELKLNVQREYKTGWWFRVLVIFHPIWDEVEIKHLETTNERKQFPVVITCIWFKTHWHPRLLWHIVTICPDEFYRGMFKGVTESKTTTVSSS